MLSITRTKLAFLVVALALFLGLSGRGTSVTQAATGGTVSQFSSDITITASSTGVTSSVGFPDGTTNAACFIQVDTKGAEPHTFGNCAGYGVTITCGSIAFDKITSPFASNGAAFTSGGTRHWTGQYDQGPSCTTVAGQQATLSADVTGYAAGTKIVVWWNNDTQASRDGCVSYVDAGTSAASQCFTNAGAGPNGTFYELTGTGTMGTAYETATGGHAGNITLGGVFIGLTGSGTAPTPAATVQQSPTAIPTATPRPAAANGPARYSQFTTDPSLTIGSAGITSSQAFPDGGTKAACYIPITTKSGVQSGAVGQCAGLAVNVTCSSYQFSNTPLFDAHGSAVVLGGVRSQAGGYDTGPSCATIPNATLSFDVTGLTAGTLVAAYFNNDGSASRDGCVQYKGVTITTLRGCFTNRAAGANGTLYEVIADGASGTFYQTKGQPGLGGSGNLTAGGVFIGLSGGTALSATPVSVTHGNARAGHPA